MLVGADGGSATAAAAVQAGADLGRAIRQSAKEQLGLAVSVSRLCP